MENQRRYDIDWLRVIAIGLLLIYHIAIVFQPWALFIGFIRSDELHTGIWQVMTLLNVWRIPLLFYVSGMGVYFAMQRRSVKQLLGDRARRILLPYLFGMVAIVPLHFLVFQDYYQLPLAYAPHSGHLWFLGNIVIYISLLFPLFYYLLRHPENRFRKLMGRLMESPLGPMALIPFFILEVVIVQPEFFSLYAQTLHGYGIGLLAFFFGFIVVYVGAPFWKTLLKARSLYLGAALLLYIVRLVVFEDAAPNALIAIESNLWIFALFGFGYRYLNKPSKALNYLAQAVYPIYIIHMAVLYAASSVVLPLALPVLGKFALINLLTFSLSLAIYELLIRRVPFLRPLFGLNFRQRAKTPPVAEPLKS